MADALLTLTEAWRADIAELPSAERGEAILSEILARHAEAHRRYHGRAHLCALVDLLNWHARHIPAGAPPRLAIWWHDAIYDPQAQDNEQKSADLACSDLARLGASRALIEPTANLILMTKNHWAGPSAGAGDYFLDADIGILGAPAAIYNAYAAGVREEYAWPPSDTFRAGRSAFLKAALGRPRLFRTDVFEAAYAEPARANMRRELCALSSGVGRED